MIGEWMEAPELVLQPKTACRQRIVSSGDCRPNLLEAKRTNDGGIGREMNIVIPQETPMQRRPISEQRRNDQ